MKTIGFSLTCESIVATVDRIEEIPDDYVTDDLVKQLAQFDSDLWELWQEFTQTQSEA